ncbi:MAG: hypothetical protein AYK23_02230 [Candidatus Proteinoplasmatales archaeon SG8-5]|nr:MAG: hypothetical protein AYK23_02230 [Candidatus Proteinoplasmatales archaeon SG8-5]
MLFEEMTTFEVHKKINERSVAILPIGALEEHGPHLPLATDNIQPEYVAHNVAELTGAYVLPIIKYGVCSSTKNFPGTITLRFDTLRMLIEDILNELARTGFKNVVVLSGHAGRVHMTALKLAGQAALEANPGLKLMILSDYDIAYTMDEIEIPVNDGHAGMIETSRILAIRPGLVKGTAEPSYPNFPEYRVLRNPEKYFPSGVMGEPLLATKEFGENANQVIVERLVELIEKMVDE